MSFDAGYILSKLSGTDIEKEDLDALISAGLIDNKDLSTHVYVTRGEVSTRIQSKYGNHDTYQVQTPTEIVRAIRNKEDRKRTYVYIGSAINAISGCFVDITDRSEKDIKDFVDGLIKEIDRNPNTSIYMRLLGNQLKRRGLKNPKGVISIEDVEERKLDPDDIQLDDVYDDIVNICDVDSVINGEFGIEPDYFYRRINRKVRFVEDYDNIGIIQEVCQPNPETRIAVYASRRGSGYWSTGARFGIIISRVGDGLYDYLDRDRLILTKIRNGNYHSVTRDVSVVGVFDNNITKAYVESMSLKLDALVNACARDKGNYTIITTGTLAKYKDVEKTQALQKEKLRDKVANKILNKKSLEDGLKISGLLLNQDGFEYEGVKVTTDSSSRSMYTTSLVTLSQNVKEQRHVEAAVQEVLNFNALYDSFIDDVAEEVKRWSEGGGYTTKRLSYSIDNIDITITKTTSEAGSSRYLINGIRVNFNEVRDCLARALCYQTQEDFDEFLKIVSNCSLAIHRVIESGINVRVELNYDTDLMIKMRFRREGKANYLIIDDDTSVKIRDLRGFASKFKTYEEANLNSYRKKNFYDFCNIFSDRHFKNELTEDMLVTLVNSGKRVYDEALKKSKELLESAVKATGAVQNVRSHNGQSINGYDVVGVSGNTYFVSDDTSGRQTTSQVYTVSDDGRIQYVCIVDRSLGGQVGKDTIVNRLYAMKNDSRVVDKIHTLGGIV